MAHHYFWKDNTLLRMMPRKRPEGYLKKTPVLKPTRGTGEDTGLHRKRLLYLFV